MVEDLVIVGAGGSSRDIAEAVEDLNSDGRRWNLLGFLDDDPARLSQLIHGYPGLGPVESAERFRGARFIIGIANYRTPLIRREVAVRMQAVADRFATVIHPAAHVSRHAKVGAGTAILASTIVSPGAFAGDHVILSHAVVIGHETAIGDYVTMAARATLTGRVQVDEGAYIGAASTVLNSRLVGQGAVVGIGAVVIDNVAPYTTVFGNPAKLWTRHPPPRGQTVEISRT